MIKIIEAYSDKILANVKLTKASLERAVDKNGIEITAWIDSTREFNVNTSPHKSIVARELAILSAKLEATNKKEIQTILMIIRHGEKNLHVSFRHLDGDSSNLASLCVNGIPFYKNTKKVDIDKKLLGKMNTIYNLASAVDKSDSKVLRKTVDSIINCYTETGLITKQDLRWLNKIFRQYKSEGAYDVGQ